MARGVLLLSHCGYSFMEDLVAALRRQGRAALVLSSQPAVQAEQRIATLTTLADRVLTTEAHGLTWADVAAALDRLEAEGWRIDACVSVWEGYRRLMAEANRRLGTADLAPETVAAVSDKLLLRNKLTTCGFGRARAEPASDANLAEWLSQGRKGFVKPRRGVASYGALRLRPGLKMADLERVHARAALDPVYADLLDGAEFLLEDYIDGQEYSFEVIAQGGRTYLLGVHLKLEVTETSQTVLEDCCVSPPLDWTSAKTLTCRAWLERLMAAVGADWGCFHIEARLTGHGWELIEINPRVGGALISASVAAQTGDRSLLDFWLRLLLAQGEEEAAALGIELAGFQEVYPHARATFFRVYFARPGTIQSIRRSEMKREPDTIQCFIDPGTTVEESDREVFLGQALWSFDTADRADVVADLIDDSRDALGAFYLD